MKIGIDIDNVVADFIPKFIEFYNLKTGKNFKYNNWTSYNFWDVIEGTKDEAIKFVDDFYQSSLFNEINLVRDVKGVLEELSINHELCAVTSRPLRFAEKTDAFFEKYFSETEIEIFYSDDFHKQHSIGKAGICVREGIEIFVEDNLEYALSCSEKGVRTFLLDKPWNQGYCNCVKRVNNWKEIIEHIKKMEDFNNGS